MISPAWKGRRTREIIMSSTSFNDLCALRAALSADPTLARRVSTERGLLAQIMQLAVQPRQSSPPGTSSGNTTTPTPAIQGRALLD